MPYSACLSSVLLHIFLLLLLCLSPSFYRAPAHRTHPVTVMIDLQKMTLADKTNLPAKAQKPAPKPTKVQPKTPPKVPPQKQTPKPTPEPKPIPKQAAPVQTKPEAQPKPTTPTPDVQAQQKQLQNLLNNIEKRTAKTPNPNPQETETTQRSLSDHLTFTEIDLIASELRQVWNVDANAEGLENLHIQIRISLNIQGQVTNVDILDQDLYQNNRIFRSVADSARRAIYICDKRGEDSPFRLLARNHADDYSSWKEIVLHFNPLTESVS